MAEPIPKIPPARVASSFPVPARRGEEGVAVATATKPQRGGTGKLPQPAWDMASPARRCVAADSECKKHTFVLAPCATWDWPISRAEVFLRWVLCARKFFPAVWLAALSFFAIAAPLAFAQVKISTNIPGPAPSAGPCGFVSNFYTFALWIGGVLAFGAIVYGGVKYTFAAGNPSGQSEGKEWVRGALLGLLLLVGAYIILNTINPDIVKSGSNCLPTLAPISLPSGDGGGGGGGGVAGGGGFGGGGASGDYGRISDQAARNQLAAAGVGIKDGVGLDGVQQRTIDEIVGLKKTCDCDVTVTSATEGNHAEGACSHTNGFKADVRPTTALDNFITKNFVRGATRSDGAQQYVDANGAVYARESDHWDMKVGC